MIQFYWLKMKMNPRVFLAIMYIISLCSACVYYFNDSQVFWNNRNISSRKVLNMEMFGGRADGKTDNSEALSKAWDQACNSLESVKILVPKGKTYFVKHINFTGPCNSNIHMEIQGTIKAFPQMYDIPRRLWIMFKNLRNIEISGGGTIDGNGDVWWKYSCKIKKAKPCQTQNAPAALTFRNCTNLRVSNLKIINAQQMQMVIQDSRYIEASKLQMIAPKDSPNTDGIHVSRSTNVGIFDSSIKTGDDCISMVRKCRNVEIRNLECGHGHGISIGGLGGINNKEDHVADIFVKGATIRGAENGLRIKTWLGGKGRARNMVFEDIEMENVTNPIVIDQYYCDQRKNRNCDTQSSGVAIENVVYRNISGTSASEVAINLKCSRSVPCRNILLENVVLTSPLAKGDAVLPRCSHYMVMQCVSRNSLPHCPTTA